MNTKMLGKMTHECPYGRTCTCNPAPGKATRSARRLAKRQDRANWKREVL